MIHICAECEHFLGCGDWDLCCRKQVRRLTYEYCESCEEFEHGVELDPVITANLLGERHAWKPKRKMTYDECVETALELEEQGYEDVQIRNDDKAKFYPLLWMRGRDG